MRHAILTCKNHTHLRWSCKEIAIDQNAKPGEPANYNSSRSIFFNGTPSGKGMYEDGSGLDCTCTLPNGEYVFECSCSSEDLIIAPEDALVKRPIPAPRPVRIIVPNLSDDILRETIDILKKKGGIEAIKFIRDRAGIDLKTAFQVVQYQIESAIMNETSCR